MTHTFINDLTIDTVVNGYYILADIREKVSRTGTPYLLISLKDKSGYISATAFDYPEEITEDARGNAVYVSAEAILFNEKLQLKVKTIRLTTASDYSEFDLADLLEPPSLPLPQTHCRVLRFCQHAAPFLYRMQARQLPVLRQPDKPRQHRKS